jgi:hypothetical protein
MSNLPPEVLAQVKENLANAEAANKKYLDVLNEAHLAGLDVTQHRDQQAKLATQIRQMKAVYGKQ